MRLFHVSEDPNISLFVPRVPTRTDLDPSVPLVWAISEERLSNFLTPRDCPRVGYHVTPETVMADRQRFFTAPGHEHALVIEDSWFSVMRSAMLWLYEFDPSGFELQDAAAGYYVAKSPQAPIGKYCIDDVFDELFRRDVEVRIVNNLRAVAEDVQQSTLDWSLCRMQNAQEGEAGWNSVLF